MLANKKEDDPIPKVQLNSRIDANLVTKIKIQAIHEHQRYSYVIEKALKEYLKNHQKEG